MADPLVETKLLQPRATTRGRGAAPAGGHARACGGLTGHAGLGTGRVREDVAPRGLDEHRTGRTGRSGRAPSAWVSLDGGTVRRRRSGPTSCWPSTERSRLRRCCAHPAPVRAGARRGRARRGGGRAQRPAWRRHPGPRRLSPCRQRRRRSRNDVPRRPHAATTTAGHQHPRRPRTAPVPAAGTRRARRDPRIRPPLHA